jgi:ankyrin repeat protein
MEQLLEEFRNLIISDAPDCETAASLRDWHARGGEHYGMVFGGVRWKAAHILAQKNKPQALDALFDIGADAHDPDLNQWAPLDWALQHGNNYAAAKVVFDTLLIEYDSAPDELHQILAETLIRQRQEAAEHFILMAMGLCVEEALACEKYERAQEMITTTLTLLRECGAEFASDIMHQWSAQASSNRNSQFFISAIRRHFEYEGARFAPELRRHFETVSSAPAVGPSHARPVIEIAPGILDYPAA